MAILILAEKPSVASDIARCLGANQKGDNAWTGSDLIISWAIGHLIELAPPEDYDEAFKNWRSSVNSLPISPDKFITKPIQTRSGNKAQLNAIKKFIKSKEVSEIVNACDAAREGELIFRRIVEHSGTSKPMSRMWLRSMTDDAIKRAWEERVPSNDYDNLSDAAHCRAQADWLIGMNGTRIATVTLPRPRNEKGAISLGRVQTPTLAMVVDHEIDILSHVPSAFWEVHVRLKSGEAEWDARWERQNHKDNPEKPEHKSHRIHEEDEYKRLTALLNSNPEFGVSQVDRNSTEKPPLNLDLNTLQREANTAWSWSAKKTLGLAQDLYDRYKLTTYPRTDSRYLPEDMMEKISATIRKLGAQSHLEEHSKFLTSDKLYNVKRNFDDNKVSDHFAIIPTGKLPDQEMSQDHTRLYDLICRTFLASFHPEAIWRVETRKAIASDELFKKEVRVLATSGWRAVKPKKGGIPSGWGELPANPCEASLLSHEFKDEQTKPPNRLKEARLLSLMENAGKKVDDDELADAMKGKGLGTPATRAETIETLIRRGYIARSKRGSLRATPHGIRLINLLRRVPVKWITSARMTGEMEQKLSQVEKGEFPKSGYMDSVNEQVESLISLLKDHDREKMFAEDEAIGSCPICSAEVRENVFSYSCVENKGKGVGCPFIMWKESSGRWFDRFTAARILSEGSIQSLHGFFNQSEEEYQQDVQIKKNIVSIGNGNVKSDSDDEVLCSCPICSQGSIRISATTYSCDLEDCSFRGLRREMSKREILPQEAKTIFEGGKSDLLTGFTSKRGSEFSAYLQVQGNRIVYDFPPREPDADATIFEVVEGVVGVCKKHSVEVHETPTTYQSVSNDKGCSITIQREMSKRTITRQEAKEIIEGKGAGPFDDFTSKKTGRPFSAQLYLKSNERVGYKFAKK